MNFGDLQTYVLSRLSIAASETATVTQVKTILNQVLLRVHADAELQITTATVTVAANASSASLPADLVRIKSILNGTVVLQPVTDQVIGSDTALTNAGIVIPPSTVPVVYTVRTPSTIDVWPVPTTSTALALRYVQRPSLMVNNTDPPGSLPAEYHDMLAEATIERVAAGEEAFSAAQLADSIYARLVAGLLAQRAQIAGPTQSRVKMAVYG